MTSAYIDAQEPVPAAGVYPPQHDSHLLIEAMTDAGLPAGKRVADLCTGSGIVAIAAADAGATEVKAFDVCPQAVRFARANALGTCVDVRLGSWSRAVEFGPFDLVVVNPPYVPEGPVDDSAGIPAVAGPPRAWNAGPDGRLVLDPLCASAPLLVADGGTLLVVQSEFAGIADTVRSLHATGMRAEVVAQQLIPFGPVMTARAEWLERRGLLSPGRRVERLAVIRADAR